MLKKFKLLLVSLFTIGILAGCSNSHVVNITNTQVEQGTAFSISNPPEGMLLAGQSDTPTPISFSYTSNNLDPSYQLNAYNTTTGALEIGSSLTGTTYMVSQVDPEINTEVGVPGNFIGAVGSNDAPPGTYNIQATFSFKIGSKEYTGTSPGTFTVTKQDK